MIDPQLVTAAVRPLNVDSAALVDSLRHPPRQSLRLRPGREADSLPFSVERVPWHPRGYFVAEPTRLGGQLEFAAGDYYIQDAASLLAVTVLDAQPGERICDLCASPGGKSTAILEALDQHGCLLANEPIQSRRAALEFNLARHGSVRYAVSGLDPQRLAERLAGHFDAVLVDAPCSGQSLIGRGKQTESAFAPRTIEHCAARQQRILEAAAQLVGKNGRLVYSTCTFALAENETQIENFLAHHGEWSLEEVPAALPWQSEYGPGHYRLWPHLHGCGGAYAVRLRRGDGPHSTVSSSHADPVLRPSSLPDGFAEWGSMPAAAVYRAGTQAYAWPEPWDTECLAAAVAGPEIGFRKGSTWFPSYALAMRHDPGWLPRQFHPLDDAEARRYIAGEPISGTSRGWSVVTWQGRPLGWVKGDGQQLKNHLPKPARAGGGCK